jgi:protein-tyrosine-phosphatase
MNLGPRLTYPVRVLFLCTGNSARSQIAEAVLQRKGGERFVVASAGASPAQEIKPEAIEVLRGNGIDWSGKLPKGFDAIADEPWDLVITLCDRIKETCPALPSRPVTAHWGVPDPAAIVDAKLRRAAFSNTLNLLSWRIDLMLAIRLDQFESWVLENRLEAIAKQTAPERQSGGGRSTDSTQEAR